MSILAETVPFETQVVFIQEIEKGGLPFVLERRWKSGHAKEQQCEAT